MAEPEVAASIAAPSLQGFTLLLQNLWARSQEPVPGTPSGPGSK